MGFTGLQAISADFALQSSGGAGGLAQNFSYKAFSSVEYEKEHYLKKV